MIFLQVSNMYSVYEKNTKYGIDYISNLYLFRIV